ncbi:tyrosine-type recombinase/integrase [Micromonospora sp. NPDC048947]|uniref:tyrosine-type recombinase/integrase n=1 Tax=Micromonospora sp. NPDC048947 TaxID=3154826 RepID=UPI0033CF1C19
MSALRQTLADYLAVRRALGYKLERAEKLLGQFLDYLHDEDAHTVTVEHAIAWATAPAGDPWWHALRMNAVRPFAVYLHAPHLGTGAHVSCIGKGRKQRITPLTKDTVTTLKNWLKDRGGVPADPLFPTRSGTAITRDALERRVTKHAATAALACPTLAEKKISPHVLRHSAAMRLLNAGVDTTVIALWLGHESVATTQIYIHADLALKERALARTTPLGTTPGRYQPTDTIVAFLENL